MARVEAVGHLRAMVRLAAAERRPICRAGVRSGGRLVDLAVTPIEEPESLRGAFVVTFEDARPQALPPAAGERGDPVPRLDEELRRTTQQLQAVLDEAAAARADFAAAAEQLRLANQELQSANQELKITNEELGTSREELQSVNAELVVVNAELQAKNEALAVASDDVRNLLDALPLPVLFVDPQLRILRFTRSVARVCNLLPRDVGRPLTDVALELSSDALERAVRDVVGGGAAARDLTATGADGARFVVRVYPYVAASGRALGAVLAFLDAAAGYLPIA
jgi:two-component system CheB/CheR fusion protein